MFIRRTKLQRIDFFQLFLLILFLNPFDSSSLPCDDNRCKTGSCDKSGDCICNLPNPSTILEGDRPFLGGRFCDEDQIMCDGTISFWCEHGASCNEIVQGENYTCNCLPGYAGLHCEHIGAPCGQIFCFHEAECLVEGDVCECPTGWKGSVDCSLPTRTVTITNSTDKGFRQVEISDGNKWFVPVFAISCSLGAVVGVVMFANKHLKKRETTVPKFQQLSQMQMHGILDDEDDDTFIPDVVVHHDSAHL
ncbi:uncharacterized protein LOC143887196 [Tasmannia lanceolata]|uniref:uncharacterized protein LOC143887196 n=1 Tax=Tasmannia lanceolata TaxID=3420 RepID=UPI0040649232